MGWFQTRSPTASTIVASPGNAGFPDTLTDAIVMRFGEIAMTSVNTKRISEISTAYSLVDEPLDSPKPLKTTLARWPHLACEKSFEPNEIMFKAGKPNQHVLLISAGVVRRYKTLMDGRRQILGFSIPGDWIVPSLGNELSFSADAIDAVRAHSFRREGLNISFAGQSEVLARLYELAQAQLAEAEEHILLLGRRRSEEKIACFLLTMRERWARLGKRSVTVHLPMSRRDIADYLGVTMETVSRTLARFAREGVILPVPEGVRLLDVGSLEQLSGLKVSAALSA